MKCMDVMTPNPACCAVGDNVSKAAQLMNLEDVGSIPVVDHAQNNRLVGIVTDRDLAMKVLAERRDPRTTMVEHVMTNDLVTCYADDDVEATIEMMAEHQVRRVPVIDRQGQIVGIIAQADIALRAESELQTAEVVEEISKPV